VCGVPVVQLARSARWVHLYVPTTTNSRLREKGAYVKAKGLGGVIQWELNEGYLSSAAAGSEIPCSRPIHDMYCTECGQGNDRRHSLPTQLGSQLLPENVRHSLVVGDIGVPVAPSGHEPSAPMFCTPISNVASFRSPWRERCNHIGQVGLDLARRRARRPSIHIVGIPGIG